MDHQKRNRVLGIITIVFAAIAIFGTVGTSTSGSYNNYSAVFKLSPSGYIECDFGETNLVDFTATITLTAADLNYDGITAYLVDDQTSSVDGPYARGYHTYTYGSIGYLDMDYTNYYGYSSSITFYQSNINYYYTSSLTTPDFYRIVVVPAVDHDFNSQNVTVSISISTTARSLMAIYAIPYVIMLAIPAILLGISAIVSANATAPKIQPRPQYVSQYVYTPTPPPPSIQKSAPPSNKQFCRVCGSEVQTGQRFCDKCGTAV